MPSSHLIPCRPLLLLPSIFPSIRVFSNESALHIRWPKYWSFSFNISFTNEHPGLISFRMDWLDLLAVQGTLKSLLQQCRRWGLMPGLGRSPVVGNPYLENPWAEEPGSPWGHKKVEHPWIHAHTQVWLTHHRRCFREKSSDVFWLVFFFTFSEMKNLDTYLTLILSLWFSYQFCEHFNPNMSILVNINIALWWLN